MPLCLCSLIEAGHNGGYPLSAAHLIKAIHPVILLFFFLIASIHGILAASVSPTY